MRDSGETDTATKKESDADATVTHGGDTSQDSRIDSDKPYGDESDGQSRKAKHFTVERRYTDDNESQPSDFVGPTQQENLQSVSETTITAEPQEASTPTEDNRPEDNPEQTAQQSGDVHLVMDIPVHLTLEVGGRHITIGELMTMKPGDVVSLDRGEEDPLDVKANGILIARGEVVLVNERYGVRLLDIVSPAARLKKNVFGGQSS